MSGENTDPRVEPGIGRSLEMARKSRGLSLWQVEQETRIRSRYLHDLERENFDVLPAVYVLGSLKTYADFLGLDGAALSRQLKASLVEPAEADAPDQPVSLGDARDEDDEYEAAPVPAVGFDQLFLGMGVILVSILAVMTIVTAVAQGDESPISQISQPSTPEAPSEIALAGNVREEDGGNEAGGDGPAYDESTEAQPETPKDEGGEEDKNESEKDDGEASQSVSLFGDAEFVPVSPASPTADASASASPSAASSAASSPAPTTAEPDDARASAAPEPTPSASTAPSSSEASPRSSEDPPGATSPVPSGGGAPPRAGGGGGGAPAGESGSDPMSTEVDRMVGEALKKAGIVR
ncbi:MAG TPA: helix-turn-helix domain-containing protein [Rubrobacter sp.]|nr:helix-turn-helix domain-containing protein [Rubrobacter sp.]